MKSMYCMVGAGLLLWFLAAPGSAHSGDTRDATVKTTPSGAMGSLGSGSITGKTPVGAAGRTPVGAAGKTPVGAAGSLGSGSVTGKTAPQGVMRRVYTPGSRENKNEEEEDDTE
jgi:hypothetical protein